MMRKIRESLRSAIISVAVGLGVASILVLLAYLVDGSTIATRTATELAMPIGLTWIALLMATVYFGIRRQWVTCGMSGLLFVLVGVTGNQFLASKFAQSVELAERQPTATREHPYRTVVVLGGGATISPTRIPELNRDGERVFSAAQLWHDGLVASITCSGSDPSGDPSQREFYTELLTSVGVPRAAIFQVPGENTTQEMRELKRFLAEPPPGFPETGNIALITSAFHMQRALRLAQAQGLQFEPLPCGYRKTDFPRFSPRYLVPNAIAASDFATVLKEYLGGLVGR
jgi:uncharacterized SAM-binding protein YcdF (DUF218 family)